MSKIFEHKALPFNGMTDHKLLCCLPGTTPPHAEDETDGSGGGSGFQRIKPKIRHENPAATLKAKLEMIRQQALRLGMSPDNAVLGYLQQLYPRMSAKDAQFLGQFLTHSENHQLKMHMSRPAPAPRPRYEPTMRYLVRPTPG